METNNQIIIFENNNIKLNVNMKDETVWLTQEQMIKLFQRDQSVISRHIRNIFKERELDEKSNMQKMHIPNSDKLVTFYNLDVIISVGYRVKSQNGIIFRRWATNILKEYMLKGYVANQKRLEYLEKTIKVIDIANRIDEELKNDDAKEILKIVGEYSKALDLLDFYDHGTVKKPDGNISDTKISYKDCINVIEKLRFSAESNLFAVERIENGLESIINDIYQTFDNNEVYKTIEEKAANFLYLIVKNHVFVDGNKRVAATLFIYFLNFYHMLHRHEKQIIDNNTLTALTLLIAESNPKEKEVMTDLVMNFLT